MHRAVFQHVDLHAGGLDDGLDLLSARADQVADLVLSESCSLNKRGAYGGNLRAALAQRLFHGVQNLQTSRLGLGQRFAHHRDADAQNLDVHLQRGNARARAGHLEVHVAVMIFGAGDIGQDRHILVAFATTRPIAMPAHGAFIGTPASISASEPPQTVAIEDEPFDSRMSDTKRMVYGKSVFGGEQADAARARPMRRGRFRGGPGRAGTSTSPTLNGGKL